MLERTRGARLAASLALSSALLFAAASAQAEKVGVAAAVNPDAFSTLSGAPQTQLNIGKSIFYNERINTTGSGLVQVLLVDGSTFTVGPGSDLVIDKFVYNPGKGTGEISASFSKGVMRFVGGKISKNEGGVTVNTPAGTLAIRGGMAMGKIDSPKNFAFVFLFGKYLALNGDVAFEYPWGFFANNGNVEKRAASADEIKSMVASLSSSHSTPGANQDKGKANNFQLANTDSMNQLISDANTQQILAQAPEAQNDQSGNTPQQPPSCEETGTCPNPDPPSCEVTGTCPDPDPPSCEELGNCEPPPSCEETGTCEPPPPEAGTPGSYAAGIYDRKGSEQEIGILRDVLFDPSSHTVSFGIGDGLAVLLGFDENGNPVSASVTLSGDPLEVIQYKSQTQLTMREDPICDGCDDITWGTFETHLNFRETSNIFAAGWWISGELTTVGNIDTLAALGANATYNGTVQGTVINNDETYDASGDLTMHWSFRDRNGDLTISDFDERSYATDPGGLTQPSLDANKFGGSLHQTEGPSIGLTSGNVAGSFVNNGGVAAGGVIGKWGVAGDNYHATGVFGGAGTPR